MNYQGNNKLFISIGFTVLLISSFLILVLAKPESRTALATFSGAIVFLSSLGIYVSTLQVKKIKMRVENLPTSYQSVYLNAHELLGTQGLPKGDIQEIMSMILEIFEHANIDNRKVDDIISNDLGHFLQGFIDEAKKSNNLGFILTYSTSLFISYLLLIKAYKVLRTGSFSFSLIETETLDVGIVVMYALIGYIFFPWLLYMIKRSTRYQWHGIKRLFILTPFIIPLGLMMGLILLDSPELRLIVDRPVPLFTNVWSIGIGIILLLISLWALKVQRKR